jgi:hypothetical protein
MNMFTVVIAIINTLVRLVPIGLYTGSAMNALVMNDFRGVILLFGFFFNEMLSLAYRMFLKGAYNPNCALLMDNEGMPFVLPSPICQTVSFFFAFSMMDMYYRDVFLPVRFYILLAVLIATVFSRVNVGCKSIIDAIMASFIGLMIGIAYYEIMKSYYRRDFLDLEKTEEKIDDFFSSD